MEKIINGISQKQAHEKIKEILKLQEIAFVTAFDITQAKQRCEFQDVSHCVDCEFSFIDSADAEVSEVSFATMTLWRGVDNKIYGEW